MILQIERRWKKATYTIGRLYVDGEYFCNTLEDKDRGLRADASLSELKIRKVPGETAIPAGTYRVSMNTISPKYAAVDWYQKLCGGKMPRLINVPAFSGILFHPGTTALDTRGCILVGENTKVGALTNSRETFRKLYLKLQEADSRGELIMLHIA